MTIRLLIDAPPGAHIDDIIGAFLVLRGPQIEGFVFNGVIVRDLFGDMTTEQLKAKYREKIE